MDWLSKYGVVVNCYRRKVTLIASYGALVTYQGGINPVLEE